MTSDERDVSAQDPTLRSNLSGEIQSPIPTTPAGELSRLAKPISNFNAWLVGSSAGLWILGIGLALRVVWIFMIDLAQPHDAQIYFDGALSIQAGEGLPLVGTPSGHWPVGYQGFLGGLFLVFGVSSAVAQVANVVLSAILIVATQGFVRRATGSVGTSRVAMALLAFSPTMVVICSLSMPEVLYLTLMMVGAWVWLAIGPAVLAAIALGSVFGFAVLVRPQFVLLPIAFAMLRPFSVRGGFSISRRIAQVGIAVLSMAIIVSPWLARNMRAYGHFVFVSTNSGIMMLVGNGPNSTGRHMEPKNAVNDLPPDFDNGVKGDRLAREIAIAHIMANPGEALARLPWKLWYTFRSGLGVVNWVGTGIKIKSGEEPRWYVLVTVVCQGFYMAVVGLGSWMALMWGARRGWWYNSDAGPAVIYSVIAILLLIVPVLVAFGSARYNLAMMPWFSVLAAIAIDSWLRSVGGSRFFNEAMSAKVNG